VTYRRPIDGQLDNRRAALVLLLPNWGDQSQRIVVSYPRNDVRIEVSWIGGAYDMEVVRRDDYPITDAVFTWLQRERFIEKRPVWGGRHSFEWVATQRAEDARWRGIGLLLTPSGHRYTLLPGNLPL